MTIKQIEAFFWISELGSFSAAAVRLNATQPAISNRIKDFEAALRVQLFDAGSRLPRLTPKGREVLSFCDKFLRLGHSLELVVGTPQSVGGLVKVGAADTMALTWIPELISRVNESYPQIDVELSVDLSLNLQSRLADRDLDIVFLVGPISDPKVRTRPLGDVENAWMCGSAIAKRLSSTNKVPASEIAQFPIFTHSRGSHHHQMVMSWFEREGLRPPRVHGCNSLTTMIHMTVAGLGVSVLPAVLVAEQLRKKRLSVIHTTERLVPLRFLMAHQAHSLDGTVQAIADIASKLALESSIFLKGSKRA